MKVINSKELGQLLEEKTDPDKFFDFDQEEDYRSPCWEVKIARELGCVLFLIDGKEIIRADFKLFKQEDLNDIDYLVCFIKMLRKGDIDGLCKKLGIAK